MLYHSYNDKWVDGCASWINPSDIQILNEDEQGVFKETATRLETASHVYWVNEEGGILMGGYSQNFIDVMILMKRRYPELDPELLVAKAVGYIEQHDNYDSGEELRRGVMLEFNDWRDERV